MVDSGSIATAVLMMTIIISIPDLAAKGLMYEFLKKKSNFTSVYIKLFKLAGNLLTEDHKYGSISR